MSFLIHLVALQVPVAAPAVAAAPPAGFTPLEVTKLVIDGLTPLVVLLLGIWVHKLSQRVEQSHWANQKVIEKRIAVYDAMAPRLNDLLCFCTFVGAWQTLSPSDMLGHKRELDRQFYISMALFSAEFEQRYQAFINTCFRTFGAHGTQARLKIGLEYRQQHQPNWQAGWVQYFTDPSEVKEDAVRATYRALMGQFSGELGLALPPKA